jgi:hypothetical protein
MQYIVQNSCLERTVTLHSRAGSIYSGGFDLAKFCYADDPSTLQFIVFAPAVPLKEGRTIAYTIEHDTDPNFGSAVPLAENFIVQTAESKTVHELVRIPADAKRYARLRIDSDHTGTLDHAAATIRLFF